MKKKLNIFFLLIYINTLLISEGFSGIELIANRNAKAWDIQHSILADDNYSIQLNKNDVVKGIRTAHIIYDDSYTGEYKLINGFYSEILIKDKKYYIRTDNIIQKKSEGRLPEKIITKNDGTFYVSLYFIESFSKLNKDILINQEKAFKYLNDWFLRDNEHFNGALNLFQTSISFEHLLQYGFWIEKVKFDKEIYQINIKRDIDCYDNYDIEDLGWTKEITAKLPFYTNDSNIIFLKIDGDYIILSDSQSLKSKFIYCKVNKKIIREFVKFLNDEYYDYSSLSWPRHADGTCDYETAVRLQSGKRYRASDNLRLRALADRYGRQARRNDRQGHAGKSAQHRYRTNYRRHYKQLGASGSTGRRKRQGRESYSCGDNGLVLWGVFG